MNEQRLEFRSLILEALNEKWPNDPGTNQRCVDTIVEALGADRMRLRDQCIDQLFGIINGQLGVDVHAKDKIEAIRLLREIIE